MTTIQFGGITFDDESVSGFHISKLTGWDDGAPARYSATTRPQGNGAFRPGRIWRDPRVVSVEGSWSGDSLQDAYTARMMLTALQADGRESPFTVTDVMGAKTITAGLSTSPTINDGLYQPYFQFAFDVTAADPFKYGPQLSGSSGVPTPSSGLVWPLGSGATTGVSYAWTGTVGLSSSTASTGGTVTRTNSSANPRFYSDLSEVYAGWNGQDSSAVVLDTSTAGPLGGNSMKVTPSSNGSGIEWQPPAPSGNVWLSFYLKGGAGLAMVAYGATTVNFQAVGSPVNGWQRYMTTASMTSSPRFYVDVSGNSGTAFWMANMSVIADQGDWFDGSTPSTAGSGSYFNWGTPGNLGQVTLTNTGNALSWPVFTVTGGLGGGFTLTWVPTGQQITFVYPIPSSSAVTVDSRTGRVTVDGGSDITGFLTSSQWWSVAPGQSGLVQFTPLGAQSGTPTLTAALSPAYL